MALTFQEKLELTSKEDLCELLLDVLEGYPRVKREISDQIDIQSLDRKQIYSLLIEIKPNWSVSLIFDISTFFMGYVYHDEERHNVGTNTDNLQPYWEYLLTDEIIGFEVSVKWKDQGWGNRKGQFALQIEKGDGSENDTRINLFGTAEHNYTDARKKMTVETDGEFFSQLEVGDKLLFKYRVGGGGGHQLTFENFRFEVIDRFSSHHERIVYE